MKQGASEVFVNEPAPVHRKRLLGICLLAILALRPGPGGAAGAPDALTGTWLTADADSKVEIAARRAADGRTLYDGKVVWLATPTRNGQPVHDEKNGDPALRARPILGLEVLSGFEAGPNGVWSGGTMYAPRKGRSFEALLSLAQDGRLQIDVKAGLLSETIYWTRSSP